MQWMFYSFILADLFALYVRITTGEWSPHARYFLLCTHLALWARALQAEILHQVDAVDEGLAKDFNAAARCLMNPVRHLQMTTSA
ncbi:hypothetical protein BP00DRAFT_452062 [Aspergillus indologenus CBS 114.80]|uniref:Uncharacterized protein n=1 Tax=Aspergillus indologenus CBS 114.80 TaxID=1450541 RepID=A0A2V5HM54_9EURO|nr:hypothetical protein BP00DRAFT_452062 [Aspergillus indologenus CBS 114.80]